MLPTLADLPSFTVPVRSFSNPKAETTQTYTLSKHVFSVPIRKDIVLEVVRYQVEVHLALFDRKT